MSSSSSNSLVLAVVVALSASCVSLEGLTSKTGPGGPCGNGIVDTGEQCDGDLCCTPTCEFASAATVCRAGVGPCDNAELCTGADGACPVDGFKAAGTECRASKDPKCDPAETCSGTATDCPTDKSTCANVCRPNQPCVPGQTCTATDEVGCNLACNCADENVYSCSSSCCPEPAVNGKSCGAAPATSTANAACDDACGHSCKCQSGVWACNPTACAVCPNIQDMPTTNATAYADINTICTYVTTVSTFAQTKCVSNTRDAASNAWQCTPQSAQDCAGAVVQGKGCGLVGGACSDSCGHACTCAAGAWSCTGTCNVCPTAEEQPNDTDACLVQAGTVCTYTGSAATKCQCVSTSPTANTWSCKDQAAFDCTDPAVHGQSCTIGTNCNDACGSGCACSAAGTWQCASTTCKLCPTIEEMPAAGALCFSSAGTVCTYVVGGGAGAAQTRTCTCNAAGATNNWSCQ